MADIGLNGQGDNMRRRLLERITTIKIHAGIIRRAARRPDPLDKEAVIEQVNQIDRQVTQAAQILAGDSSGVG
jgi:hypothetical protein